MVNFGQRLKKLRTQQQWTQELLAERIGVTKSAISTYENTLRLPTYDVMIKLARIFHVSTDYLLGIEKKEVLDITDITEEQKQILALLITQFKQTKPPRK